MLTLPIKNKWLGEKKGRERYENRFTGLLI